MEQQRYIVALEIGSSKIRGAAGALDSNGALTVLAIEEEPLIDCVRYGVIQNVEEVSTRVNRIMRKIENRSGISPRKVKAVYVALGGRSLAASQIDIERPLPEEMEITERMVEQIKADAMRTTLSDRDTVDVMIRDFMIDNQESITPVGMFGRHIDATLNVISCRPQIKRNIDRVVNERLQLKINGYIVRQTAIADLVLSKDEKRLGCMLVDLGAETTTVSIYKGGVMRYMATLPMGSRNITRDIATGLNKLEERAEELKKAVGDASPSSEMPQHRNLDGIDTTEINNFVQARAGEIVANILEQMNYGGITDLPCGIVIVGGGAKLKGISHLIESQSKLPLRIGTPTSTVRIADAKIQGADTVDVIAILDAASRRTPMMCMEAPEPIYNPADDEEDEEDEYEVGFMPKGHRGGKAANRGGRSADDDTDNVRSGGFLSRLKDKVERIFSENDEDDDEDE
ncbi:MAG: cell division protein FtsA [Pseudoflavonifractor sp.]|nr:cell division protein FtsA [Pseudoflavonifractor sp.]